MCHNLKTVWMNVEVNENFHCFHPLMSAEFWHLFKRVKKFILTFFKWTLEMLDFVATHQNNRYNYYFHKWKTKKKSLQLWLCPNLTKFLPSASRTSYKQAVGILASQIDTCISRDRKHFFSQFSKQFFKMNKKLSINCNSGVVFFSLLNLDVIFHLLVHFNWLCISCQLKTTQRNQPHRQKHWLTHFSLQRKLSVFCFFSCYFWCGMKISLICN